MNKPFSSQTLLPQPIGERNNHPHKPSHSKAKWTIFLLFLFLGSFTKSIAQEPTDYSVHANIIYHFTKYIDWPESRKTGDFVVGVVGETPLYDQLIKLTANKWAGTQKIVIRKFSSTQQTFDCHILFIAENESRMINKIASRTGGEPILLVTEDYGSRTDKICMHFAINDEKLSLEINKMNIRDRHLRIANELLELAKVIN
ncbi:MAG: YfiR family protein [Flavitalea sp.]